MAYDYGRSRNEAESPKNVNLPLIQRRMLYYGLQALQQLWAIVNNPEWPKTSRTVACNTIVNKCLPNLDLLQIDGNTPTWVLEILRVRAIGKGEAKELPQQVIASEITTRDIPVAVGEGQSPESIAAQGIEG